MLRVLIADPSPTWRAIIRASAEEAGICVVAEAETAQQAAALVRELSPDLALIDLRLDGGALMSAARLVARHPRLQVVMMAETISDDELFAMLRAGANGYVEKDSTLTRLPHTLRDVMAGQVALPRPLMARIVDEFARRGPRRGGLLRLPGIQRLSNREQEVIALLVAGLDTGEIARQMYVEPSTVRSYITRALQKLRIPDRSTLLRTAARHGVPVGRL